MHRPSYLDYVGVKRFDAEGEATGERRFLGLYAFSAYSVSAFDIPIVRRKVGYVLERAGFHEGATTRRTCSRSWRPTRATSCSRSRRRSSSRSRWASSTSRSASA